HEIVLAAPLSLRALLAGRWLGAVAAASLLGLSTTLGFFVAPILEVVGALPEGSFGPVQWGAIVQSHLVFTLPSAAGLGAIYLMAAIRTRSTAGPIGMAVLLMVSWMAAMVLLRGGDVDLFWATVLDPSAYGEAEHQVLGWTPAEKRTSLLALTPALVVNRLVWGLAPLVLLGVTLARLTRETLVLGRERPRPIANDGYSAASASTASLPGRIAVPSWARAFWAELGWQTRGMLRNRGVRIAGVLWATLGAAGSFVHIVGHADGPLLARPALVLPMLIEFSFMIVVLLLAGTVGAVARSDDHVGLSEVVDATPAPEGVRQFARVGAAIGLTALLCATTAVVSVVVSLLAEPASVSVGTSVLHAAGVFFPATLELCALMYLAHALVRPAGQAYAIGMLMAFVFIVNNELGVVTYPPFKFGIPVRTTLSGLTGMVPWAGYVAVAGAFKLAMAGLLFGVAALVTPRGVETGLRPTLAHAGRRLRGGSGALLAGSAVVAVVTFSLLWVRLVDEGGYQSPADAIAEDAAWEARWLARGAPVDAAGGQVALTLTPGGRAEGRWTLRDVRGRTLHAELPDDFALGAVRVDGRAAETTSELDHLAIALPGCDRAACEVDVSFVVEPRGWDADGEPSWTDPRGVWLRAEHVLPRLGLDLDRVVRRPTERRDLGLPDALAFPETSHAVPARGVAPPGDWSWHVALASGEAIAEGSTSGPLDFVATWSTVAEDLPVDGRTVNADPVLATTAAEVVEDLDALAPVLAARIGALAPIERIVAAPRGLGSPAVVGTTLWLPEDHGWDAAAEGVGRQLRRVTLAEALVEAHLTSHADLRATPAGAWLSRGVARAAGLLALGDLDGDAALQAVLERESNAVALDMAGSTDPILDVASASTSGWTRAYLPLAALSWTAEQTPDSIAALLAAARQAGADQALRGSMLGPPRASDIVVDGAGDATGTREVWRDGGWDPISDGVTPYRPTGGPLLLDRWSSYERSPSDNATGERW
ncbi:MAG: ABC transporter permease, partial [Myxococcota bacterium]